MIKRTIKTTCGNYDLEFIDHCVATISKSDGNCYLHLRQLPKKVRKYIKANYMIKLLDVDTLNRVLGLVI